MIDRAKSRAEIETDVDEIPIRDLSYFLYYFRATYVTALNILGDENFGTEFNRDQVERLAYAVSQELESKGYRAVSHNALSDVTEEKELTFAHIARRNPIELVFGAVGIALAAAVILSGGKFRIDRQGLQVELPPLGVGIAELKKAIHGEYKNGPRSRLQGDNETDNHLANKDDDGLDFGG